MDRFSVGDYVTIKKKFTYKEWYHTEPMLIIEVRAIYSSSSCLYIVDYDFVSQLSQKNNNTIHHEFIELSKSHIRMDKLERIFNEECNS